MSGNCVADTRPFTCDRSNSCCDSFGELRRPGLPCTHCIDSRNKSSCVSDGFVCGDGESLGLCIKHNGTHPISVNNQSLCASVSCEANEFCLVVANTPFCHRKYEFSCKYLCNNPQFNYTAWPCDSNSDCSTRGSCCSDYSSFCDLTEIEKDPQPDIPITGPEFPGNKTSPADSQANAIDMHRVVVIASPIAAGICLIGIGIYVAKKRYGNSVPVTLSMTNIITAGIDV